jgi:hypothetical protein
VQETHPGGVPVEVYMELGNYAVSVLVSLVVGILGFLLLYKIFDWLTP